jgi:hypothetical protein
MKRSILVLSLSALLFGGSTCRTFVSYVYHNRHIFKNIYTEDVVMRGFRGGIEQFRYEIASGDSAMTDFEATEIGASPPAISYGFYLGNIS